MGAQKRDLKSGSGETGFVHVEGRASGRNSGEKPDTTKKEHSVQSSWYIPSQVDGEHTMQFGLMKEA